jgi:hypothetical protein
MWWVLASSGQLSGVVNSVGDYVMWKRKATKLRLYSFSWHNGSTIKKTNTDNIWSCCRVRWAGVWKGILGVMAHHGVWISSVGCVVSRWYFCVNNISQGTRMEKTCLPQDVHRPWLIRIGMMFNVQRIISPYLTLLAYCCSQVMDRATLSIIILAFRWYRIASFSSCSVLFMIIFGFIFQLTLPRRRTLIVNDGYTPTCGINKD